jgi:hypothetical protein
MTTLYPPSYAAEFNGEGLYRPSLHKEVVGGIVGGIARCVHRRRYRWRHR